MAGALRARAAKPHGGREAAPADMLRDVLGGEEPSAEAFLREVAPALLGAVDEAKTLVRVAGALRVRLDGSPGTPELRYE